MKNFELNNIDLKFSDKEIFKGFSIKLQTEKIYALIGASGIGKSTLLNIFSGMLLPDYGDVKSGIDISYQFQNPVLLNYLNIIENCLLGIKLKDNTKQEINLEKLLYKFGFIDNDFNKYPSELSGGMKQRISIIQTLLVKSELYLFDEPLNSIDGKNINIIIEHLWKMQRKEKSTFLIVTHNLEQAISICDEVLILKSDKTVSRISFDNDFTSLNPLERKTSPKLINYIAKIVKESD